MAGAELSDLEVEQLRDGMALLVTVALDRVQNLPSELLEEVGERAAIMEFDGGLSRAAAERTAMLRVIEGARNSDAR